MAKNKKNPFLVPPRKKKPKRKDSKLSQTSSASFGSMKTRVLSGALDKSAAQSPTLEMCRLCETKDGPFLDIFAAEQTIGKKINVVLPFVVTQYDGLPRKICFRCSAKVEELNDFVEKCTKTQNNLRLLLGKDKISPKYNLRQMWEERLSQLNITNDEFCDAVIEKAMEGITHLKPLPLDEEEWKAEESANFDGYSENNFSSESKVPIPVKIPKQYGNKLGFKKIAGPSPLSDSEAKGKLKNKEIETKPDRADSKKNENPANVTGKQMIREPLHTAPKAEKKDISTEQNHSDSDESSNLPIKTIQRKIKEQATQKTEETSKPFNIMDHISIIKVNGVGVLFQCKLCNRNFLKKDVVESHGCAKTGVPKLDYVPAVVNVEPPKNPMASVKYITNKVNPESLKKNIGPPKKTPESTDTIPVPEVRPRPRIGPASKVKKTSDPPSFVGMKVKPREVTPPPTPPTPTQSVTQSMPAIEVPAIPGMKSRYRLVPGPNNSFTLVEDPTTAKLPQKSVEKHKIVDETEKKDIPQPKKIKVSKHPSSHLNPVKLSSAVIDVDEDVPRNETPYPVGFFTSPSPAKPIMPIVSKAENAPATFTTPAMKKQSYTVVQTGNPSKLLISAKPRPQQTEVPKTSKSKKRTKHEVKPVEDGSKKPYNVTIEDTAPPKDAFFTFISLDPLLQPSYVLPTEHIIQESQISTSTNAGAGSSRSKDGYECSLCPEKFSREKKLLAHLQSHYNKMDDDNDEIVKPSKKKSRKT